MKCRWTFSVLPLLLEQYDTGRTRDGWGCLQDGRSDHWSLEAEKGPETDFLLEP
jgi:hypothetical protein